VDLAGGLDEILKMGSCEEVSEVDELAVVLVLDIDDTPFVLSAADLLAANNDRLLAADNCKWDDVFDGGIGGTFLVIKLVVVVRVHLEVVEGELLLDSLLECSAFLECEGVGLGNYRDDVHHVRQLLEHHDVDRLQGVAARLDEEEAAMDSGVRNVSLSLGGEFLAEIGRVLIFDVFDNGVPASVIVHQVTVARSVDDAESQSYTVLFDDMRDGLDISGGSRWLIRSQTSFRVDQM